MNRKFRVELIEENIGANFYSICFGDEDSEFDKFFDKFPVGCEYDDDMNIITEVLDKIGMNGADRRYRPEGSRYGSQVYAIPIETSKLRLYCLVVSEEIIIFGNGGVKKTAKRQQDPELNGFVEILESLERFINSRLEKGSVTVHKNQLFGNLNFILNEKK